MIELGEFNTNGIETSHQKQKKLMMMMRPEAERFKGHPWPEAMESLSSHCVRTKTRP
jgi:hypothetical protein